MESALAAAVAPSEAIPLIELPVYKYAPILDRGEIRLFKLYPGNVDDPISCEVEHVAFSDRVDYEALSYVWGESTRTERIRCGRTAMDITANLYSALKHLRSEEETRSLWVDAISIDQDNLEERAAQVQQMNDVYAQSQHVLVWLGEADQYLDRGFASIRLLYDQVSKTFPENFNLNAEEVNNLLRQHRNYFDVTAQVDWIALYQLLARPWFRRRWVIQEVVAAGNIYVCAGNLSMEWETFSMAMYDVFRLNLGYISPNASYSSPVMEFARLGWVNLIVIMEARELKPALMTLLLETQFFACSDPRDAIYAFYGIASDKDELPENLRPDYTITDLELFVRVTKWWMNDWHSLKFLRLSSSDRAASPASEPSWLPSLFKTVLELPVRTALREITHTATPKKIPDGQISDDGRHLRLKGILLDTVTEMTETYLTVDLADDMSIQDKLLTQNTHRLNYLRKCETMAKATIEDSQIALDALIRTLTHDMDAQNDYYPDVSLADAYVKWITLFNDALTAYDEGKRLELIEEYLTLLLNFEGAFVASSLRRKFGCTKEGRLGSFPPWARIGDKVCVLYGGSVAYLIRPAYDKLYNFVGECYVHGVMRGEALCSGIEEEDIVLV